MTTIANKRKLLDSVATIDATVTDATIWDLRGIKDPVFEFLCTLNTGFSTGSAFFIGEILGCDTKDGTFVPYIQTAELVVNVPQNLPSPANAPGTVLPRFIKVRWTETGSMTSFTATCKMHYNRPDGAGPGVNHNALS